LHRAFFPSMAEAPKSTARRDGLQAIEAEVQKKWDEMKVFECDAGEASDEKFMVTFPYPYMNGMLHIGHAYSLTKAVFAAHFNRLLGKKVLFPFGFHCTGMPIQAAANKLTRDYAVYGKPYPTFPPGRPQPLTNKEDLIEITDDGVSLSFKPPSCTGKKGIKAHHVFMKVDDGTFKEVVSVEHTDAPGKVSFKAPVADGKCVYMIRTELADGSYCPDSKESDEVSIDAAPKDKSKGKPAPGKPKVAKKILAKTGDAAFQWEILHSMGIPIDDMPAFCDPLHWLQHFPPLGERDLKRFGAPVDFRRSFITTSVNPYYDSFVRWQFGKLKKGEKIGFGKRPTIYSEIDGQACMDHDRAEGEGVGPQEYTAIKIELVEVPPAMSNLKGKNIFLLAATLRAETMPGQTNCWILPQGKYGCFKADADTVYVCSHRAARNMSFQDILTPWGKPECLQDVMGKDLIGCKVRCPTSKYDVCHLLPLLTIKMDKGTGIVTSVPSDSPDDYAAFMDLMKPGKREHHGIKAEWVEPFELIPIIDVEIDGEIRTMAAQYMCEKLGVQSQNDTVKLLEAHDVCYKLGFDKGIMSAGPFKGQPVKKAKLDARAQMVKDNQAFIYSEPEKKIVSRSGDECVVASIDQWYLKYGEEGWKNQVENHLNGDSFVTYNARIKESFQDALSWLKEWACSRSFGLGTRVPWDEKFVIESLSDSTVYMAYYTVAHFLQDKALDGSKGGSGNIKPEQMTEDVWDYIYLKGQMPKTDIPKSLLEEMRKEFRFWYPMDLRVSGKDLIQNHLTMSLYNHACVWEDEPELWPRGFFCNGHTMVNNEKMSKSKGNFFTLADIIQKHSADAVRFACANCGDTLEDGNFEEPVATGALLKMPVFIEAMKALITGGDEPLDIGKEDSTFLDRWFANELNRLTSESKHHYATMYYREALRTSWFEFCACFDQYRDVCKAGKRKMNKTLVMRYLEWQMIILSPIAPHFCEHGWGLLNKSGSVLNARWPELTKPVDSLIVSQGEYMFDKVPHDFIKLLEKASKGGKPTSATVYVALKYPDWKVTVLSKLRELHDKKQLPLVSPDEMKSNAEAKAQWTVVMMGLMQDPSLKPFAKLLGPFAAFTRDEAAQLGASALSAQAPFDELALLMENVDYLKDKLGMDVDIFLAEQAKTGHADLVSNAQPSKPVVVYAGASGGGAGAGAGAAGKGKTNGSSSVPLIKDLRALNDHLSTRSYFEGGGVPTAADAGQLAQLPKGAINAEQYPHVARWHRHVVHFSPEQKSKW